MENITCQQCDKEYDFSEACRVYGDTPWLNKYCSAQCYTQATMSGNRTDDIVRLVGLKFRTFGGGIESANNPIAQATIGKPFMFAAGVDVREVVQFIEAALKG